MRDYTKIRATFPKAWEICYNHLAENKGDFNDRDLYDFFDKNNLIVRIAWEYVKGNINWCWSICWYKAEENRIHPMTDFFHYADCCGFFGDNGEYKNRSEAEESAFARAFELMEKRLNGIDIDLL